MERRIATSLQRSSAIIAVCSLFLCGCIHSPVPIQYSGPTANISDSSASNNVGGVNFFFLEAINGHRIDSSLLRTTQVNSGAGFSMRPVIISRDVPAQAAVFTITGRTHYAAPIQEILNRIFQVRGAVRFTPQANHFYLVKGILSNGVSSIWIEDEAGTVMDRKIMLKNAALGILEK